MRKNIVLAVMAFFFTFAHAQTEYYEIQNDCFWNTAEGKPMYTQGGGIFRFPDPETGELTYYWYGNHYKEAELYRDNPRKKYNNCTFVSVSCYSSKDMVNWHEETDVLTAEEANGGRRRGGWLGRLGVGYLKEINKYVLLMQQNNSVLLCTSDSPKGPFRKYQNYDMTSRCGTPNTGDQTVFVDPDTQKPYLVYSNAQGRNRTYISEVGWDEKTDSITFLTCRQVFSGASREGNCMFKYKGRYYLYASNIYGWDCSYAYYLTSDNIYGPYYPENRMLVTKGCEADFAHVTQTGFFANMQGQDGGELVVYYGDRWADFANNGLGYNQVFPMSFESDGTPIFNSMSAWSVNPVTLDWRVSTKNNYVKNGSFEADRRLIPEPVKPRQDVLTGWTTTVIKGSPIGNEHDNGLKLNKNNTEEEQQSVIGKMSLLVTDNVDFIREISQEIAAETYIPLPDGKYRLQFMMKNACKLKAAAVSVVSGSNTYTKKLATSVHDWRSDSLEVEVRNGKAVLTFHIEGKAKAECRIDDVQLTALQVAAVSDTREVAVLTVFDKLANDMVCVEGDTGNFYICKYEVTQKLWVEVMGENPSQMQGDELPVEQVSWDDCQTFIRKLNELTGQNYRLPTDAEWKYACSGGKYSKGYKYSGSNDIDAVAWYDGNSDARTHPVGQKLPNELGLYDMNGNVWEWCQDLHGKDRGCRGGSWIHNARNCELELDNETPQSFQINCLGLRLAI